MTSRERDGSNGKFRRERGTRPIGYGLLVFIASGLVWVISSFGAGVQQFTGEAVTAAPLVYISGVIFFFSLPAAIVAEVIRWRRLKKQKREESKV